MGIYTMAGDLVNTGGKEQALVEELRARVKELIYKVDVLEDRIEECQMRGPCKIPPEPPE